MHGVRTMTGRRAGRPRRRFRGLGMWDAMLGVAVLSMLGALTGQVVGDWMERRLMDEESRAVAELARAGRLYVEADPAANAPAPGAFETVTFADLDGANLWPAERPRNTPRRGRAMVLRIWGAGTDRVTVIARARGPADEIPPLLPGAGSGVTGVGAIMNRTGETVLRGPGVRLDMAPLNVLEAGFAQPGDLFGLAHVFTGEQCAAYLLRVADPACPDGNRMTTGLDLGGNDLVGVDELETVELAVTEVEGDLTVTGALRIEEALDVEVAGSTSVGALTVNDAMVVAGATDIAGALTVAGDFGATGTVTGSDLVFDGTISVAGDAVMGDVDADDLVANTVTVRDLLVPGNVGTFGDFNATRLIVDNLTVTGTCNGCGP